MLIIWYDLHAFGGKRFFNVVHLKLMRTLFGYVNMPFSSVQAQKLNVNYIGAHLGDTC